MDDKHKCYSHRPSRICTVQFGEKVGNQHKIKRKEKHDIVNCIAIKHQLVSCSSGNKALRNVWKVLCAFYIAKVVH